MLAGLDTLVVDLQDVGVRSYTYISCMRYAVSMLWARHRSRVARSPKSTRRHQGRRPRPAMEELRRCIPRAYVHGMTIGELARMAKNSSGWMEVPERIRRRGKLTVIPMRGWKREMLWPDTGLKWIPTSPYIPNLSAVWVTP